MAKIRKPKSFLELMKSVEINDLMPLLDTFKATDDKGNYLHWDKFMWRVPKEINNEHAWLATKISRKSNRKDLILLKNKNNQECFNFNMPDSLFAKLHIIDKKTGGGHELEDHESFFTTNYKDKYLVKSLMMEEAITSSQLEGASTTRKVAKEMLESNRTPQDTSEQMILNNYILMKRAVEKKNEKLTIDLILEFHELATKGAIENNAIPGEFRTDDEISVTNSFNEIVHYPPIAETIKDRMEALCDFANDNFETNSPKDFIHPIIKAIILHFMIGYIHPFGDGNGRTARALFYWYMLKSKYWLFEYISISKLIKENRADYDNAFLYSENDESDLTYFLYNQVDIIIKAVNSLQDHINKKKKDFYDFMSWIDNNPISKDLKREHIELLKKAIKDPGRVFTSKTVASDFDINENTARSYLNKLAEKDLLIPSKVKHGRTIKYIAPNNLTSLFKNKNIAKF